MLSHAVYMGFLATLSLCEEIQTSNMIKHYVSGRNKNNRVQGSIRFKWLSFRC